MIHQVKLITHPLFWTGAGGRETEREREKGLYYTTGANKKVMNNKTRFWLK